MVAWQQIASSGFSATCLGCSHTKVPPAQLGVCFILFVLLSTASPAMPQPEILLTSLLVHLKKKKKVNVREIVTLLSHVAKRSQ